jgi:hypothetical protein
VWQGAGQRAGLGTRQFAEQLAEPAAEQELRGAEHALPRRRESECLPAAVGGDRGALNQPGLGQNGQQLGDGRPGNTRPAGQLRGRELLQLGARAQDSGYA